MKSYSKKIVNKNFDPPTIEAERLDQSIADVLNILGDFDEEFKYSIVNDLTTFKDIGASSAQVRHLKDKLGSPINVASKIITAAQFLSSKQKLPQ